MKFTVIVFTLLVLLISSFSFAVPTSFYSNEIEISAGTVSVNNQPVLLSNFTIANPLEGQRMLLGSGSVQRTAGTGTQTLDIFLNQNDIEVYRSALRSFTSNNVWGAFSLAVNNFSSPLGVNSYELYLEDSIGTYEFSHLQGFSVADVSYDLNMHKGYIQDISESLPNTLGSFTLIETINYQANKSGKLGIIADFKTATTRNNGDYHRYYIEHLESSDSTLVFESQPPSNLATRSTGINKIFNITAGTNTFRIYASTALATGTLTGTIGFHELTNAASNTIQGINENCGGTEDTPILLSPGWNKLCDIDYTLQDGNSTILVWDGDFQKSAVGLLEFKVNGTNITETSTIYRSTQAPNEYLHVPIRDIIPFNNSDSATIEIWVNVPASGTTTVEGAPISLYDTTLAEMTSSATPPNSNPITLPVNGSYLYNDTLLDEIRVTPFSDAQGPVYYNVNVTAIDGPNVSYSVEVVNNYYLTNFPFDYQSLPANNTYEIIVEGCNIYAQCVNTTSIFYLEITPNRTSFIGRDLDTESGTWDSSLGDTLLANGTFKAIPGSCAFAFGSGSVKKECPDNSSQSLEGTLGINTNDYFLGTLRTFSKCNSWGTYSLTSVQTPNLLDTNTFRFYFTDENATFTFNENEFLMIANYTSENKSIIHDVMDVDIVSPITNVINSFQNIYNFTAYAEDHSLLVVADLKASSLIQTASSFYLINYNTSEISRSAYTQTGGNWSTYSTGTNWVFENLPLGMNKFGLLVSSTNDNLTINGSIITLNFIDEAGNAINYGTNKNTCVIPATGLVLNPGWTRLCVASLLNDVNESTLIFLDLDAYSENNVTAVVRINSSINGDYKDYYRTFDSNSRYAHLPIRMFNPSEMGVITYETWVYVDQNIQVFPGSLAIMNVKNEQGIVDYFAPLPGKITLPEDGSVFAEDLGGNTIEWKSFLGVQESTYDVYIYLKDGGLIETIAENVTGNSVSFNYAKLLYGEDYTIVVSGCNVADQCRFASADFTFERSYELVKNECQGMLGNIYDSFDLLTVAIILLGAMLLIGAVLAMVGGKGSGMDFNTTIILIVVTSCLIATAIWLINYLGAGYC